MIPNIGFGTYKLDKNTTYQMVKQALQIGYRHIDTANLYQNEIQVGQAIKDSGVNRKEIFITTKISINHIKKGDNGIFLSIRESLLKLDVEYIDLILLHGPVKNKIISSWKMLERILLGEIMDIKILNIGVSNYNIDNLKIILDNCKIKPLVNQIEINLYLQRAELYNFCVEHDIQIISHTSLIRRLKFNCEKLESLSKKYNLSKSNILLLWLLNKNIKIIPSTTNYVHLIENFNIQYKILDNLEEFDENFSLFPQYL